MTLKAQKPARRVVPNSPAQDQNYNLSMCRFMYERGYPRLAEMHELYARKGEL